MLRNRIAVWVTLFCFAVTAAVPSFAALLPDDDGRISIVICSADGLKTIEIDPDGDVGTKNKTGCDVCQIHCSLSSAAQVESHAFALPLERAEPIPPQPPQIPRVAAPGPGYPRGPPVQAALSKTTP